MSDDQTDSNTSKNSSGSVDPEDPHPDTCMLLYRRKWKLNDPPIHPEYQPKPETPQHLLGTWLVRLLVALHLKKIEKEEETNPADRRSPPKAADEPDYNALAETAELRGLALSGGGIRSATLSLGVLQAIAMTKKMAAGTAQGGKPASFDESMLSDYGYLSTVSGGGYIGSFLCSLFIPNRLRAHQNSSSLAADDVIQVLCEEPPGRVRAVPDLTVSAMRPPKKPPGATGERLHKAPLAWLRDNGRYLTPTGAGDAFYAGSLSIRNLASVHYVIGAAVLSSFGLLEMLAGKAASNSFCHALCGSTGNGWWISPAFIMAGAVLLVWSVPAGAAFWIPYPIDDRGRSGLWNWACTAYAGAMVVFVSIGWYTTTVGSPRFHLVWDGAPWFYGALVMTIALLMYIVAGPRDSYVITLRTTLTHWLTLSLQIACTLFALAVVDSLSHTIYAFVTQHGEGMTGKVATIATPAAALGALTWLVRKIALSAGSKEPPVLLMKLPWQWLAGAVGMVILALMTIGWGLLAVVLIWQGAPLSVPVEGVATGGLATSAAMKTAAISIHAVASDALSVTVAVAKAPESLTAMTPTVMPWKAAAIVGGVSLLISFFIGRFPSFINLSSMQSFYSARLTRAYLGASNGKRFEKVDPDKPADRIKPSAAEPMATDQVSMDEFLWKGRLSTYAPIHLINVTMNNTAAPGEQLVQRDRKGQPIVVNARGFSVDGAKLTQFPSGKQHNELQRTLTLGQWTGISGAAFSTGLGRQTSLGLSLLLGSANLRLGAWWDSGLGKRAEDTASRVLNWAFPTQTYLFGEFTAKFHGLARPLQYLTDGGHFENTGVYELLRPERRVKFIIACDHGADRDYRFGDLANLIRLVRIDMQIELVVEEGAATDGRLMEWFGVPADFRKAAHACGDIEKKTCTASTAAGNQPHEPVAILLRAMRGQPAETQTWIVLLKPRVRSDSAVDVIQYALTHPAFPQETTVDQFFDEAQWESYRKLAYDNARGVLSEPVWTALQDYMARHP